MSETLAIGQLTDQHIGRTIQFSLDDGTPWGYSDTFVATAPVEVLDA